MLELSKSKRLIYIGGSGRSGSTLLDMLLSNHPDIQSVGEIHRLNLYARDINERCTCGESILDCSFWQKVEKEFCKINGLAYGHGKYLKNCEMMIRPSDLSSIERTLENILLIFLPLPQIYNTLIFKISQNHYNSVENSLKWYDAIRNVSNATTIVDSTKDPRRMKMLYLADPEIFHLIYMIRDGRAVTASAMKRERIPMLNAAKTWVNSHRRFQLAMSGIPSNKIIKVQYEKMCNKPDAEFDRISDFLRISPNFGSFEIIKTKSHNIGGNPMRFRKSETTIKLDNKWMTQLSENDLGEFERVAGRMNRKLGY